MKGKRIVIIAHDSKKKNLAEWATYNKGSLKEFEIWATENTGKMVLKETGLPVKMLLSGPIGGDAQVGAMISEGRVDIVIFFWDPLTPQSHDVDVKTLLRLAVLHDVPIACNRSTADFLISSPLFKNCEHYTNGHEAPKTPLDKPLQIV